MLGEVAGERVEARAEARAIGTSADPVMLEVFNNLFMSIAEQMGVSQKWIGYWFLFATIGLYAGIGIMSRTAEVAEYYVAGRRVPAFFNAASMRSLCTIGAR